jgi:ketosteroid isomerase-like protein
MVDPKEVMLRFIDAVNGRAVEEIADLMTDDHLFIDSLGAEVRGRGAMREGWEAYLAMVPGYRIAVREVVSSGDTIVALGTASGGYAPGGDLPSEGRWSTPAAWRAVVRGARLAVWQVFADNEPIRRLMRERNGRPH